jgi:anti-sigma factor RsiW
VTKTLATPDWQTLNAYVDGELAPAEAAAVAAALAREPELAARVASLSRLKAWSSGLAPDSVPPPAFQPPVPARAPRPLALAAGAAALLLALAVAWFWPFTAPPAEAWLDKAVSAHLAWLEQPADRGGAPIDAALEPSLTEGIPDLTEAHLTLVYVKLAPGSGAGHGLQLGYRGIHGCRVSLWIAEAVAGMGETPAALARQGVAGYGWRVGATGFALLARGMDPDRLRLLAEVVARLTREAPDEETRIALQQTTVVGAPCAT